MKIRKANHSAGQKELLLREYFLNAYLIALLKQAGNEVRLRREMSREATKEEISTA